MARAQAAPVQLLQVTRRVLEVGAVYERVAGRCQTSMGAEQVRAMAPVTDAALIASRHDEWLQARRLVAEKGSVGLSLATPLRELCAEAATPGRVLDGSELLEVARTARTASELSRWLRVDEGRFPIFAELGGRLPDLGPLVRQIDELIDEEGEVRDDASPTLTRLRSRSQKMRSRLRERLENLTRNDDVREALRDPIVSERAGRMVVPVRPDQRDRVRGIVHDTSSSGQTLWVEPLEAVDDQNRLAELDAEGREEVRRLLAEATAHVRAASGALARAEVTIGRVDALQGLARWAADVEGCSPTLIEEGYRLRAGRHPLAEAERFIPLDLEIEPGVRGLVVTGPNTGGKTVALKTMGLLAILAQAGIPVPAAELRLRPWGSVHADIGDEQSLEANLSTFSAHLHHIGSFLEAKEHGAPALVLLDELGTGTDPQEGAALGIALLERFLERGDWVIASTHHDALKSFAHRHEHALNAAMEFDPESLAPTYRIRVGEPGRSNALEIASRLGFDAALVDRARSLLGADAVHLDEVIRELERERNRARELSDRLVQREQELEQAREASEKAERERARRYEELEREARDAVRQAAEQVRREGAEKLRDLEATSESTAPPTSRSRADRRARWSGEAGQLEGRARRSLERKLRRDRPAPEPAEGRGEVSARDAGGVLRAGQVVEVAPFGLRGKVLSEHDPERGEDRVEVDVDGKRLVVARAQLTPTAGGTGRSGRRGRKVATSYRRREPVSSEIDLHGLTVEQALSKVDRYLDDAVLADLDRVRLIHGFGTFALRDAIRSWLAERPGIESYGPADPMEGGAGVTVVRLSR